MTDAGHESAFVAMVMWIQHTLLGSVATAIATVSIAAVGLLMLSGHIDWRRGAQVIVGCFILFGASTIAEGIIGGVRSASRSDAPEGVAMPQPPVVSSPPIRAVDPYAGAVTPDH